MLWIIRTTAFVPVTKLCMEITTITWIILFMPSFSWFFLTGFALECTYKYSLTIYDTSVNVNIAHECERITEHALCYYHAGLLHVNNSGSKYCLFKHVIQMSIEFFQSSRLIRLIEQKYFTKNVETTRNWTQITCLTVRHFNLYTRMFSVFVWGCNWILFMLGWFCPICLIHLIGQKSFHFEKLDYLKYVFRFCT